MEQNIKINPNMKANVPKINTIDVLASARPIKVNTANTIQHNDENYHNNPTKNVESIKTHIEAHSIQMPSIQPRSQTPSQPHNTQPHNIQPHNINVTNIPNIPKINLNHNANPQTQPQIKPKLPQQPQQPQQQNTQALQENPDNKIDNAEQVQGVSTEHFEKEDIYNKNPNLESLKVDVNELSFAITRKVRGYLKKLLSVNGSDLHLKAGAKIRARIQGDIVVFSDEIFTKDDAITFAKELTRTRFPEFVSSKEMDMTYIYDSQNRFRVNMFFQMDGVSFAFRTIPTIQNTIDELGLPKAIHNIIDMERGLVLVTGITGSGKSTTLASIINAINHKHAKHIITIEDPIEFVHKDVRSIINQRSVGMDTNSFSIALKAALREDPDIILVGEMRDIETIEMALHAAETGHLVLSTLHTLDSKETINRIISVFPTNDQGRIRAILSSTLNAIISQRLLKNKNGKRTAAVEILFRTPRIETIIAEGRDGEIIEALSEGKDIYKTQTFDQHLFELVVNGVVDEEAALEKATSPSDLSLRLKNINYSEKEEANNTISLKS